MADRVASQVASGGPGGDGRGSAQAAVVDADPEIATGQVRRVPQALGRNAAYCATAVVVIAVLLIGGYALHWSWTGFTANNQLWDWMHLLLLPVVLATFPLWLAFSRYMSPGRRRALGGAVLVFAVFVFVGYVNPLTWTGFRGQTLWSWLTLIILPLSIITVRLWPQSGRELRRSHVVGVAVICVALVTTIIGGYWAGWSWTGYRGNTVWDWLTLILAPAAVTTILAPALARRLTGAADERAERETVSKRHASLRSGPPASASCAADQRLTPWSSQRLGAADPRAGVSRSPRPYPRRSPMDRALIGRTVAVSNHLRLPRRPKCRQP